MKRFFSLIITNVIFLSIILTGVFGVTANASETENTQDFAGGCGTATAPYLIETKEHLNNVRNDLGAHYKMISDIVFEKTDFAVDGAFYNDGSGFEPIGESSSNAFTGTFDGNGFIIKNINISNNNTYYTGLFGYSKGTIKNLGVVRGNINGKTTLCYTGAIVGYNYGTVVNCYNSSRVQANGWYSDSAVSCAGGIVGGNCGEITNCYNTGEVRAESISYYSVSVYVGGICGSNSSKITTCYNTGHVSFSAVLIPAEHISSDATRKICYIGGICGDNSYNNSAATNCYYLNSCSNGVGNDVGIDNTIKCTEETLKQKSTFVGFDFENVWGFDETLKIHNYPVLKAVTHLEEENVSEFAGGFGVEEYPYLITTVVQLDNVRKYMDAHFKLMCDIDLDGWNWAPIGNNNSVFTGSFDGNGYIIKNLHEYDYTSTHYKGLFGYVGGNGTIKDLGILDCDVNEDSEANIYVGGIAGYNAGTITNCYSTGNVKGEVYAHKSRFSAYVGGISGYNVGTITNCYSTCSVTAISNAASDDSTAKAWSYSGGIVGYNSDTIMNCYNTGDIHASTDTLAGYATTENYSAGIAGCNNYGGLISCCYNIGSVTGDCFTYGIAIPKSSSAGIINNCYHNKNDDFGSSSSICTQDEMKQQSTFVGFDFEVVWEIDSNANYPFPTLHKVPMIGQSYITSISVTTKPNKLTYIEGSDFDTTGMVVTLHYNDGRDVVTTNYTVSGYAPTPGVKTITISYGEKSTSFDVEVEALDYIVVTKKPDKLIYLEGDMIDLTGMIVTAYSDRTDEVISNYVVSGYDSTPGEKTIMVTYLDKTTTFIVEVEEKSLTHIMVTTKPNKMLYFEEELFDPTGMVVTAYYNNGTSSVITDYEVISDNIVHGAKNIVVSYAGKTDSFEVEIQYTIVFKNWNGTVLSVNTYRYGDDVVVPANPTKTANNTYTYTFVGWDKPVVACAGNETYTATYSAAYIDYTIVFKNWNGTVLSANTYHYGDDVVVPTNPIKAANNTYTYTFVGWDKPVVACAGNETYTATYCATYIDYIIVFKNWNGSVLSTNTYHYGDNVIAPANPTKVADNIYNYTFAGWDDNVIYCVGDATYTAIFSASYINYTVIFKDWDGAVISIKTYHYGDEVIAPDNPIREKDGYYIYSFVQWDKGIVDCVGDVVYQAVYSKEHYHTISDWIIDEAETCTKDGSKHKECTVCGETLETGAIPAKGHASFDWIIDSNATCTVNGTKHKECTVCGITFETDVILATGEHTPSDWIIDSNASVSAPGSKHKECTVCGETLETVAIPQLKPATPKVATENALTGVLVKWNAVDGAVKYQVYRRQGGSNTWTLVGTTTGTSLTDTNVSSGIYYVYSVRAYNNADQYSDFVSANTQTRKYMAVPKLKGISNATNGLYITWNPVAGVTNGYRVYRRGAGSTYWTYLGTTKNTYFADTQVKNNSGEYFRYTVIADGGYHSKFDTTGLYLRRLSNPTLKSAVSSKTGITVKWTPVKGCLGYYVYRKTANSGWQCIAVVNGANASSYIDKTAKKGVTYTYTVRAVCGSYISYFNSGISCKDKY